MCFQRKGGNVLQTNWWGWWGGDVAPTVSLHCFLFGASLHWHLGLETPRTWHVHTCSRQGQGSFHHGIFLVCLPSPWDIHWLLFLCNALWSCFVMSQNTPDQLGDHTVWSCQVHGLFEKDFAPREAHRAPPPWFVRLPVSWLRLECISARQVAACADWRCQLFQSLPEQCPRSSWQSIGAQSFQPTKIDFHLFVRIMETKCHSRNFTLRCERM